MVIPPERMHHVLGQAEFFVGDSQSMTMEAALLGTPAFRFSSFVGKITVIRELEEYGLAFGFRPGEDDRVIEEVRRYLDMPGGRDVFMRRCEAMLSEKIDPLPWFIRLLELIGSGCPVRDIKRTLLEEGCIHTKA